LAHLIKKNHKNNTNFQGAIMSDQIIHEFEKNSTESIRFTVSEFKGRELVNIRVYYTDDDGELKPTKKGISFSTELFDEFLEGIEKLKSELD
jgi:hypothetical protein